MGLEARLRAPGDYPAPLGVHVRAGLERAQAAPDRRLRLGLAGARVHTTLSGLKVHLM